MKPFFSTLFGTGILFVWYALRIAPNAEADKLASITLLLSVFIPIIYNYSLNKLKKEGQSRAARLHQGMLGTLTVVMIADIYAIRAVMGSLYPSIVVWTGMIIAVATSIVCTENLRREHDVHPATVKGIAMIVVILVTAITAFILGVQSI